MFIAIENLPLSHRDLLKENFLYTLLSQIFLKFQLPAPQNFSAIIKGHSNQKKR
jgi:hypothetical protein